MRKLRNRKGAALVEYGLLIGGVALIAAASVSVFGHKTNDLLAATASILPGAHGDDNGPIASGKLVETAPNADGAIAINAAGIVAAAGTSRLATNTGIPEADLTALVVEVGEDED